MGLRIKLSNGTGEIRVDPSGKDRRNVMLSIIPGSTVVLDRDEARLLAESILAAVDR